MKNEQLIGYLCLGIAASLWGAMYVVGKFVMDYISPFFVLWLRYLIAFSVLFIFSFFLKRERIQKKDIPIMLWLAFIGYFVSIGAAFLGTHLTSAQMGALIAATPPIFTVFLASLLLKERLTVRKVVSIFLAMFGIVLVVGIQFDNQPDTFVVGTLILLVGAFAWGIYTISLRTVNYSALFTATYATGFALILVTPVMLWQFKASDFTNLLHVDVVVSILYLGIFATAIAFLLWNKGMQYVEAGVGSIFTFFNVIAGGLLGSILLNEKLTWNFLVGCLFVLLGTATILYQKSDVDRTDKDILQEERIDEFS